MKRDGDARVPEDYLTPAGSRNRPSILVIATALALRVAERPAPIALVIAGMIAVFGTLGAFNISAGSPVHLLRLDFEGTLPALFSSVLLFAAATLAFVLTGRASGVLRPVVPLILGLILAFMAVDELAALHERLDHVMQAEWHLPSFLHWQVGYVMAGMVGALLWLNVLDVVRRRGSDAAFTRTLALSLGAAFAWGVSQVLELLQWHGKAKAPGFEVMVVTEEMLEMVGSTLLAFALVLTVRSLSTVQGSRATSRELAG